MDPITRKEMFLAKAAGQDVTLPEPITREEKYLAAIAERIPTDDKINALIEAKLATMAQTE